MIDDIKPSGEQDKPLRARLDELNNQNEQSVPAPHINQALGEKAMQGNDRVDFSINEEVIDDELKNNGTEANKPASAQTPGNWKAKLSLHWPPHKKEFVVGASVLTLILLVGLLLVLPSHKKPVALAKPRPVVKLVLPLTVPSSLSGLPVAPNVNKQPVTGVMVENSDQARPQSGLSQAGVVFEAIAEGGITRFMALYQDTAPDNVGPIRSARPYYLQWALGFDASLAHVGGSPDALNDISTWGVKDLNEFAHAGAYHRVSSRAAPHNVYSSIASLNQVEASKQYNTVNFTGFPRKAETPAKTPTAKTIDFNISWSDFAAHYDYNGATNSYNRSEGGAVMVDANTSTQLSPKVVIAMVTPVTQGALDATGAYYSVYNDIGSGQAYIFQDGIVTIGQWTKTSATSQISFTDSTNKVVNLNPGQTWITAVGKPSLVTYTP